MHNITVRKLSLSCSDVLGTLPKHVLLGSIGQESYYEYFKIDVSYCFRLFSF